MADSCASIGKIIWSPSVPFHATYDNSTWITSCMHNVLPEAQAKQLTHNPDNVSEAAIKYYYAHAKAVG
jgi:hypothetical protein